MPIGKLIKSPSHGDLSYYIIKNPEVKYFTSVYLKSKNLTMSTYKTGFYTGAGFGKRSRCLISLNHGDLLGKITLCVKIGSINRKIHKNLCNSEMDCSCNICINKIYNTSSKYGWVNSIGHVLINCAWIEINGIKLNPQYGEWMEIWSELFLNNDKKQQYNKMIQKISSHAFTYDSFTGDVSVLIPLNFWFCKNNYSMLPIGSIKSQIELVVDFTKFNKCWVCNDKNKIPPISPKFNAYVYIDYVILDEIERKQLIKGNNTFIIDEIQLDHNNCKNIHNAISINLSFKNPVKELFWIIQRDDVIGRANGIYPFTNYPIGNDWFNFSLINDRGNIGIYDIFDTATLRIDKYPPIFERFDAIFFRTIVPYYIHSGYTNKCIYSYSFSFDPENKKPCGFIDFSKYKNIKLILNMNNKIISHLKKIKKNKSKYIINVRIYALSYNVIQFNNGICSLLY